MFLNSKTSQNIPDKKKIVKNFLIKHYNLTKQTPQQKETISDLYKEITKEKIDFYKIFVQFEAIKHLEKEDFDVNEDFEILKKKM